MDEQQGQALGARGAGVDPRLASELYDLLEIGRPVYDLNNQKIGDIKEYDTQTEYLMVESGGWLANRDYYIPFSLIRNVDTSAVYVSLPKDVLNHDYTTFPHAKTAGGATPEIATGQENEE
jgi:hypothetical protein